MFGVLFMGGTLAVFPVLISLLRNEIRGTPSPYAALQTIFLSVWLYVALCYTMR